MAANQSGDIWNASAIGSSMGEAHTTANRRLGTLCSALVLRRLRPWSANLAKREVKSPKVYVRDTGLLHFLLGIRSLADLEGHPRKAASWESFAIEQILSVAGERDAYFWRTQAGAELDLLLLRNGKKLGFEFKFSDSPQVTKSMHIAKADLGLDELFLVTPGIDSFPLGDGISAKSLGACLEALRVKR